MRPALIAPGARTAFPPDEAALEKPNGLIAMGGDLAPERLLLAYRRGIFPWFEAGQPVLWWTPEPRCILEPRELHQSRSLRRARKRGFEVGVDGDFAKVIRACAEPREPGGGTWITADMMEAYEALHERGVAHSIEVRDNGCLVGGLYGVAIGAAFFGESMFSRETDASKVALATLCEALAPIPDALVDCQVVSGHLLSLGARAIPRSQFRRRLEAALNGPDPWRKSVF